MTYSRLRIELKGSDTPVPTGDADFVFLSPHRDDVCFSLGGLAMRTGGHLISLFTESQYTVNTAGDFSKATIERVTHIRRLEDQLFISRCRMKESELHWPEAPLRGYNPFDGQERKAELVKFGPQLLELLHAIGRGRANRRPWLFCPMGIGDHRDHLLIRDIIVTYRPDLEALFKIGFYEDLHYASQSNRRTAGLVHFWAALGQRLIRNALPLGERAPLKLTLIRSYASQFHTPPNSLDRFTPAIPDTYPHEAVWARTAFSM
jgi:hypothetical protein